MPHVDWIIPGWSAPPHVHAVCTTRSGGVSRGDYQSMNPADHVNDDISLVRENRLLLQQQLGLSSSPAWLQQYHSSAIIDLDREQQQLRADGSTTSTADKVCVVMTADCLPVLLTDKHGSRVAALHAGWRGLAQGILEAGVARFPANAEILAWLGPAIGPEKFEVGEEVIEQLSIAGIPQQQWCRKAGNTDNKDKWLVDLYQLARLRLQQAGVTEISGGGYCTFTDDQRFFSYRRQGECGRMASLIWISDHRAGDERTSPF